MSLQTAPSGRPGVGLALGAVGVTIFGGTLPATRLAVAALDPALVTAARAAVAGVLAALTLAALRRPIPSRAQRLPIVLGAILLVGGFPFFSSLALRTAEASHGAVVLAILPLATAAAATLVAGERPSGRFWLFALLGTGLVLAFVATRAHGAWTVADGLFLLAAASAALGYALSGTLSRSMPGWEVICWQLVVALPVTVSVALLKLPAVRAEAVPASAWAGLGYVSLFSMFLGFFAWNAGLALGGVARVGQVQLLQVFVTLALSALLLGERLDPSTVGFAIAVAVVVAAGRRAQVRAAVERVGRRAAVVLVLSLAASQVAAQDPSGGSPRPGGPVLVFGGDRDYPPYEFLDQDGKPAGYNVDLTRAIAEVMGLKIEFRLGGWSEARAALQDGRISALQGISYSDERATQFDLSLPHTIVNHAIFARSDVRTAASLDDLRGHCVALHRAGIMDDTLTRAGYDGLVRTDTPADALRLVAAGRCDYAVVALLPGISLVRQLKLTNVAPVARNVASHRYGYAVRKGDDALLSQITEGLAILKRTGRYDEIRQRWLGVLEPEPFDWRTFFKYGAVVFVPLVFGLGAALAWTRSLHHEVEVRTASLAREVAEKERAMEEVRLNQAQLVQADKMAALGVLVSGVAHEINNPNGYILLNMPILKDVYLDAVELFEDRFRDRGDFTLGGLKYSVLRQDLPPMLDEMLEGARRIKRIVEDLKDFARREDAPRLEPVDLDAVVHAALRLVQNPIQKATSRFDVSYGERLPQVRGNAQRIEQVVVNLVLNACQALPDPAHGIRLVTRHDAERGRVVLEVHDEGVGIPPEHLPRLADPFFTTKRDTGGTGLGLAVSSGIVKEHGGTLEFRSTPGAGTTAILSLPALREEDAR